MQILPKGYNSMGSYFNNLLKDIVPFRVPPKDKEWDADTAGTVSVF